MSSVPSIDANEHLPALRRYARSLTLDATAADDLVQQALLRAFENAHQFRPGASLRAWLFAILHNQFVSGRRRAGVEQRALSELAIRHGGATDDGPEQFVLLRETAARFAGLPETQRAVLHMIGVEGLSYQQAAVALEVPIGTIMSRLSRARVALRTAEDIPASGHKKLHIIGGTDAS